MSARDTPRHENISGIHSPAASTMAKHNGISEGQPVDTMTISAAIQSQLDVQ